MTTTSTRAPGGGGTGRSRAGGRRSGAASRPDPEDTTAARAKDAAKPASKSGTKPAKPRSPAKPAAKPAAKSSSRAEAPPKAASKATSKATSKARPAAVRQVAPPRAPFVLLIVGLLGGALVSLLLLNTVLAQDSFRLTELQSSNKLLDQQRQALEREIAREESPERLRQKAEALGLEVPDRASYIDPMTGQVTEVGGDVRPVPNAAAAAAAAAGAAAVPGVVVPGQGVPTAPGGGATQGATPPSSTTPPATPRQTPRMGAGTP
ncbi:hypothetical protein ACGFNU_13160 [Spirillospora sp. NPDC048911]|uniref:hypothetical protein n=1 Tax=Spirillospora sp. NPDC048911 TaxID=3364527 RepID=UPI00371A188C